LSCDFLPVGPAYGAGKVICDVGSQGGGRGERGSGRDWCAGGAFDLGDPCEASRTGERVYQHPL